MVSLPLLQKQSNNIFMNLHLNMLLVASLTAWTSREERSNGVMPKIKTVSKTDIFLIVIQGKQKPFLLEGLSWTIKKTDIVQKWRKRRSSWIQSSYCENSCHNFFLLCTQSRKYSIAVYLFGSWFNNIKTFTTMRAGAQNRENVSKRILYTILIN